MKEKRFKVGDKVTYKSKKDCNGYYYCGDEHDGHVGIIKDYIFYNEDAQCWKIEVSTKNSWGYAMLESEFLEYDKPKRIDLFPIF